MRLENCVEIIGKRLVLTVIFVTVIFSLLIINIYSRPLPYRATATLSISPELTKFAEASQIKKETLYYLQHNVVILTSRIMAKCVLEEKGLNKDPGFIKVKDPVAKFQKMITVNAENKTNHILINVEDTDPQRATFIANSLAECYLRYYKNNEVATKLLAACEEAKNKLQNSEEVLRRYTQQNNIIVASNSKKETEAALEGLKRQKMELENDLIVTQDHYKGEGPQIAVLNEKLKEINNNIKQQTDIFLDLDQKIARYNLLKKETESLKQLYISMITQSTTSKKVVFSSIRIVDSAKLPTDPITTKRWKDVFISIFLSLCGGVSFSFILERLFPTLQNTKDANNYFGLPFLGRVPYIKEEINTDKEQHAIFYQDSKSMFTQSLLAIRTSIIFSSPKDKPLKTILVTSSKYHEGKSSIAIGLASAFSRLDERVILLDLHLQNPKMHNNFNIKNIIGLTDLLVGNADLEKIIQPTFIPNLLFIPAGSKISNANKLINSDRMYALLEELKSKFNRILIDSPSVSELSTSLQLFSKIDGIVLVAKGKRVDTASILRAKKIIIKAGGNISGIVINNIVTENEDLYYYYYKHYYGQE